MSYSRISSGRAIKRVLPPLASASGSWHTWQLIFVAVLPNVICSFLHFGQRILTNLLVGSDIKSTPLSSHGNPSSGLSSCRSLSRCSGSLSSCSSSYLSFLALAACCTYPSYRVLNAGLLSGCACSFHVRAGVRWNGFLIC